MWQPSDAIRLNRPQYEVEAECGADGRLRLSVDGKQITEVYDDELTGGGGVGVFAESFEQSPVEVRFDDFEVWPLD